MEGRFGKDVNITRCTAKGISAKNDDGPWKHINTIWLRLLVTKQ